ncbi:MAG: hypothetical protein ACPG4U_10135 [Pseudomonadales bacterium]
MSKWYEVTVKQTKVFAVELEDTDDVDEAMSIVAEELSSEEFDEMSADEVNPEHVESLKRHTDADKYYPIQN